MRGKSRSKQGIMRIANNTASFRRRTKAARQTSTTRRSLAQLFLPDLYRLRSRTSTTSVAVVSSRSSGSVHLANEEEQEDIPILTGANMVPLGCRSSDISARPVTSSSPAPSRPFRQLQHHSDASNAHPRHALRNLSGTDSPTHGILSDAAIRQALFRQDVALTATTCMTTTAITRPQSESGEGTRKMTALTARREGGISFLIVRDPINRM
jgi:hypothetical protein